MYLLRRDNSLCDDGHSCLRARYRPQSKQMYLIARYNNILWFVSVVPKLFVHTKYSFCKILDFDDARQWIFFLIILRLIYYILICNCCTVWFKIAFVMSFWDPPKHTVWEPPYKSTSIILICCFLRSDRLIIANS